MRTKQPITFWTMLVGAVVAVAVGGWLTLTLWPGDTDEIPSAQAAVADACANASELNHFDAVITSYREDGSQTGGRTEMTVNKSGYREMNYFDGILESEIVRTYTLDDSDAGRSDTQARSYDITQYHRPTGGSWEVSELSYETAGSGPEFCGYAADSFNTMRRVGSTTLNGESVTQYEGTIDLAGERWDATWQFWVNSEGRLVQLKVTRLGVGIQTNYSGFNEVNVIAAPLGSSAAHSEDGASEESNEEATEEPTEEPTLEPTEAATVTEVGRES